MPTSAHADIGESAPLSHVPVPCSVAAPIPAKTRLVKGINWGLLRVPAPPRPHLIQVLLKAPWARRERGRTGRRPVGWPLEIAPLDGELRFHALWSAQNGICGGISTAGSLIDDRNRGARRIVARVENM